MEIKKKTAVALFCTIFVSVLFTSCFGFDDPVATPEYNPVIKPESDSGQQTDVADVTIMYFAHGGGNLDEAMIKNMRGMYKAESSSYENVKIAIEYKFSAENCLPKFPSEAAKKEFEEDLAWGEEFVFNSEYLSWMAPEGNSTLRFVLDPKKTLKEQAEGHYLPGKNADITNPDSLTNFINWATKVCPAKKYVLILNDHGGSYMPHDELYSGSTTATRGVIYDDGNDGSHFSAPSLAHAIKAARIRPNVLYFDACLMNTMEYLFELKDVTDYVLASTYTTIAGPPYSTLIECLSGASDNLEYAFEKYIEYWVHHFERYEAENAAFYYDATLTKTAKLDQLGKAMREFTDRLCDTYKNGTTEQKQKIDDVTKNAVKINKERPSYDIARYMEGMRKALPEVFDDVFWTELKSAFNSCIAAQYTSKYLQKHDYQVDYSVLLAIKGAYQLAKWDKRTLRYLRYYEPDGKYITNLIENGEFKDGVMPDFTMKVESEGQWDGTLESVYGALAFDKTTGWSRWLLLNEQQPSLWCNNDFGTPLPDPIEE
jgi:hypothetical protein